MGSRSVRAPLSTVAHLPLDLLVLLVGFWRNLSCNRDRKVQGRIRGYDRHDRNGGAGRICEALQHADGEVGPSRAIGADQHAPPFTFGVSLVNDQNRPRGRVQDVGAYASEQLVAKPAPTTRAHDHEVVPVVLDRPYDLLAGCLLYT